MIPGSEGSPGEGTGYPLQYSCLENPMDREVWWATVLGGHKESDTTKQSGETSKSNWCPMIKSTHSPLPQALPLSAWSALGCPFLSKSLPPSLRHFKQPSGSNKASRILVPQPGMEPLPPAVEAQSLNHWMDREVHHLHQYPLHPHVHGRADNSI